MNWVSKVCWLLVVMIGILGLQFSILLFHEVEFDRPHASRWPHRALVQAVPAKGPRVALIAVVVLGSLGTCLWLRRCIEED